MEIPHLQKQR